ncbi:MAG: hypothetical protein MI742_08545 [Desulfobacterales bacterium]|nr:hypothetical protein [Desulfobacterales bacterium]
MKTLRFCFQPDVWARNDETHARCALKKPRHAFYDAFDGEDEMQRHRWIRVLLLAVLASAVTACGGSSGGGGDAPNTRAISGVVDDGPVVKATVYAQRIDGTGSIYGPSVTDAAGRFSFSMPEDADFTQYMIVAKGGKDRTTGPEGLDLTGMEMMAPLEMFQNAQSAAVVSPVTTLVGLEVKGGSTLARAKSYVAGVLKVSEGSLGLSPTATGGAFHAKAMVISLVAKEKHAEGGSGSPFSRVEFDASTGHPDADDYSGLSEVVKAIRDAAASGEKPGEVFVRKRLLATMVRILDSNSASSEKEDLTFKANAKKLVDHILQATGAVGIDLSGMTPERIVRRVLSLSGVVNYTKFKDANFETLISWVKDDDGILTIASSVAAEYDTKEKLLAGELLGDDNAKRIHYYFHSDASHFFQAEKLIETILDDTVNDEIMKAVAQGKADAGFINEAKGIISSQIFSSFNKGDTYRRTAQKLIPFQKKGKESVTREDIVGLMEKSELYFKKKIEAAGKAYFDKDDAKAIDDLARDYREFGEAAKAKALTDYLKECMESMASDNATAIVRIFANLKQMASAEIEAGNEAGAFSQVGTMFEMAKRIPATDATTVDDPKYKDDDPNVVDGYTTRVYYLGDVVDYYKQIHAKFGGKSEYKAKVIESYESIKALRDKYPFVAGRTWNPIAKYAIPALLQVGDNVEAEALVTATPAKYKGYIYKPLATAKAIGGNMDAAFAEIDKITKYKDKLCGLLRDTPQNLQIAGALIKIGSSRYGDATRAMEKAKALIESGEDLKDTYIFSYSIHSGYLVMAEMYRDMGKLSEEASALASAEALAKTISTMKYKVRSLDSIAVYWKKIGNDAKSKAVMLLAREAADSLAVGTGVTASDIAYVYQWLLSYGYNNLGFKEELVSAAKALEERSLAIFDENLTNEQWGSGAHGDHDKLLKAQAENLYVAANAFCLAGEYSKAVAALDKAIPSKFSSNPKRAFFNVSTASTVLVGAKGLVKAYAKAGAVDKAVAMSRSMGLSAEINKGLKAVAEVLSIRDRYPETKKYGLDTPQNWVASVDTDGDGKPNFFHPLAETSDIEASGLTLDDDSDGDGTPDTSDRRPLFKD